MPIAAFSLKRPVLTLVCSLLLMLAGLAALHQLPLREYPNIDAPVVSVSTDYPGAAAEVVDSRITQVIEDRVAGIEGVRFIESNSEDGRSNIKLEFALSRNMDDATNDVRDRVNRALPQLPPEAKVPDIQKVDANEDAIVWFNLASDRLSIPELTDYANRYLADRYSNLPGVARIRLGGAQTYAMRIWLDIDKLSAYQLTPDDVENALRRENVELPAGVLESKERQYTLKVQRHFTTEADFGQLIIQHRPDAGAIRLQDVARVQKGSTDYRNLFRGNGSNMIGIGVIKQSTANTLTVAKAAKALTERLNTSLPNGMQLYRSYDSSLFIEEAIHEVYRTFIIAAVLVVLVIYAFLGSARATLIPAITLPICILATFFVLRLLDYSLNMLTLLALILSIGLVVDDAIVVLENIHRRIKTLQETPRVAAIKGTQEVGFAVLATTFVLVAVFAPIAFIEGDLGRLFAEFAVTLSAAVLLSAFVALTLSPVLAAQLLTAHSNAQTPEKPTLLQTATHRLTQSYSRTLSYTLTKPWLALVLLAASFAGIYGLYTFLPKEYTPNEDRGSFNILINGPEGASYDYMKQQMLEVETRLQPFIHPEAVDRILVRLPRNAGGFNTSFTGGVVIVSLHPWQQRPDAFRIMADMRKALATMPGVQVATIMRPGLAGRSSKPVEVVLTGGNYYELSQWRDTLFKQLQQHNPGLIALDSDYKQTSPQFNVQVNYEQAAALGVSLHTIARTLETLLASRRVTSYIENSEEYDLYLQSPPDQRRTPEDLARIHVRANNGALVSLANVITITPFANSKTLNRFNRNPAITLEANLEDSLSLDQALKHLETLASQHLPQHAQLDYKGRSRAFKDSTQAGYLAFAIGILVMYLVLAAQFESFLNPVIILITLPLALMGGLIGIACAGSSLNLYSQMGLILLLGLAAKNGILIVEFANQKRSEGLSLHNALIQACQVRLRPILMTNLTALAGAIPLILSSGAGAETRNLLGATLFAGIFTATLFTLWVVPMVYSLLARFSPPAPPVK